MGPAFIFTKDQSTFKDRKKVIPYNNSSCKSRKLIYVIVCPNCKEFYIGQTGNALSERVRVQLICSPETQKIPLSAHFDTCGKGYFTIFPFYMMGDAGITNRLCKEKMFVKLFKPFLNGH